MTRWLMLKQVHGGMVKVNEHWLTTLLSTKRNHTSVSSCVSGHQSMNHIQVREESLVVMRHRDKQQRTVVGTLLMILVLTPVVRLFFVLISSVIYLAVLFAAMMIWVLWSVRFVLQLFLGLSKRH